MTSALLEDAVRKQRPSGIGRRLHGLRLVS